MSDTTRKSIFGNPSRQGQAQGEPAARGERGLPNRAAGQGDGLAPPPHDGQGEVDGADRTGVKGTPAEPDTDRRTAQDKSGATGERGPGASSIRDTGM